MNDPVVYVVDDDDAVRDALVALLDASGYTPRPFPTAAAFLDDYDPAIPGCLVLDIRMPGMSGPELQSLLVRSGHAIPIIFITGHGDVPTAVRSMKSGAIDFIQKPFKDETLLSRIDEALAKDARERTGRAEHDRVEQLLAALTPREREVLGHVVAGKPNKGIAYELGISERTVEIHRSNVMHKMDVGSLPELVDMMVRHEGGTGSPEND